MSNAAFLRLAYNTVQGARGKDEMDPLEFDDYVQDKLKLLDMDPAFLERSVNDGFSGGEKKRNEILQMAILEPKLAILDEADSGLDIDALRIVANGVNQLRRPDNAVLLVTHYQRLLNYIVPDFVHVMDAGRIIKTGGKELALELESRGYDWVAEEYRRERRPDGTGQDQLSGQPAAGASDVCQPARARGSIGCGRTRSSAPTRWRCRPRGTRSGASPTSRRSTRPTFQRAEAPGIAAAGASSSRWTLPEAGCRLIFVDGHFAPALSDAASRGRA